MARLTSELFVRLLDGVTRPAAGITRAFNGIGKSLTNLNGAGGFGTNLANAAARANQSLDATRGRMFDAVAMGYAVKQALTAPISAATEFGTILEDMGQKAGIPTAQLGALGVEIRKVADETNQAAMEIALAVDTLLGKGATREVALAAAAPIGQAATAYNAATADLADASFAAVQNLGIAAGDIGKALDIMAFAGKAGAFELKDMAGELPGLAANYQRLGQSGTQAVADISAALQIMRRGTGTSGEAATNLGEVMNKIFAPATVRAFKKEGVDIFDAMADAADRGLDPLEAIAEITNDTLDGDLTKLGFLFGDKQAQQGLTTLIQGLEDYRKIRDEAMNSEGTVSEDYARRMQDNSQATKRWANAISNLNLTIGEALMPTLSNMLDTVIPILQSIGSWINENPKLTASIITATTAVIGFRIATTALRYAGLFGMASVLGGLSKGFLALGAASNAAKGAIALQTALANGATYTGMAKLGTAIGAIVRIVPGLNLVGPAISIIGGAIAAIGAGGLAIIAGIGTAGLLIWKYWDRLGAIFSGVGTVIGNMIPDFEVTVPYAEKFARLGNDIGASWNKLGQDLKWIGEQISGLFSQEVLTEEEKAKITQATIDFFQGMLDYVAGVPGKILESFQGLGAKILTAIGSIDIGSLVRMPAIPGLSPESGSVHSTPKGDLTMFAEGGRMRKGETGIVGDGGEPEFFTAGADGYITPFSMAGSGGGANGRPGPSAGPAFNPTLVIQGHVYGVDDLEARFQQFAARMQSEFATKMAGGFADTETA